ncbi:uncharacterized protein LOC6643866 isoform X1 [Drosophila willistoni]|uniref:uncharacterized protein LOC6643866 isoform X1 n=1 Tax=Drosophila willistoni TaxID=7260 RepID=UPI00017D7AA5|nr:uncharacterized protein LOC6643866 isoform X1 [Drosophila willistoni]
MKPDILTFCILATTILGSSTRHVIGFLTVGGDVGNGAGGGGPAAAPLTMPQEQQQQQQQQQQRLQHLAIFGGNQPRGHPQTHSPLSTSFSSSSAMQDAQERSVYDPGDELLRALNSEQELGLMPQEPDYADTVYNELEVASKMDMLKKLEDDLRAEQELVDKSALLMKMLEDPSLETLPLVYVEEDEPIVTSNDGDDYAGEIENAVQDLVLGQSKSKRSRYYRRYPWKRHNKNRGSYMNSINSNYEPELRYACTPSKEDIFKLLMNLHENRKGNHSKTVNFCNRKRPAKAVFTNIRFLG